MDYLPERVFALNQRNKFINKVVPLLIDRLNAGFKQKDDCSFYKVDQMALNKIIEAPNGSRIRASVKANSYSIWLWCDINYPTGNYGCAYLKTDWYLFNIDTGSSIDFEPIKMTSVKRYKAKMKTMGILRDKKSLIEDSLYSLSRELELEL